MTSSEGSSSVIFGAHSTAGFPLRMTPSAGMSQARTSARTRSIASDAEFTRSCDVSGSSSRTQWSRVIRSGTPTDSRSSRSCVRMAYVRVSVRSTGMTMCDRSGTGDAPASPRRRSWGTVSTRTSGMKDSSGRPGMTTREHPSSRTSSGSASRMSPVATDTR